MADQIFTLSVTGLGHDGLTLHREVETYGRENDGTDYFTALAQVTGRPELRELGDLPPSTPVAFGAGVEPRDSTQDRLARHYVAHEDLGYTDALQLAAMTMDLAELESKANEPVGSSTVPWKNLAPLPEPPRPWSEDDFQRDVRRAKVAGFELSRQLWEASAEDGRDIVAEHVETERERKLLPLPTERAKINTFRAEAQVREAERRREALKDELDRRVNLTVRT